MSQIETSGKMGGDDRRKCPTKRFRPVPVTMAPLTTPKVKVCPEGIDLKKIFSGYGECSYFNCTPGQDIANRECGDD
jgi:hypothetical protein